MMILMEFYINISSTSDWNPLTGAKTLKFTHSEIYGPNPLNYNCMNQFDNERYKILFII